MLWVRAWIGGAETVIAQKRIRIIKKIRESSGTWRFVSLQKIGNRYVWDKRPGTYFIEWWEGKKRKRQVAGRTPIETTEAQRRKRNELIGKQIAQGREPPDEHEATATPIVEATAMFLDHVRIHSPTKPRTRRRYQIVLDHCQHILGNKKFVEAITRSDIEDYKAIRSRTCSQKYPGRTIAPQTINFEVGALRYFFNFLINERGIQMPNPCARSKPLKDERQKAKRRPPTYTQQEIDTLLDGCDDFQRSACATLLLSGLREQELYYLMWPDVDVKNLHDATIRVSGEDKEGFSPKDYEERIIPIPKDLGHLLSNLPRQSAWVFPNRKGERLGGFLQRLKKVAKRAGVPNVTLHKFRHTYATRLLESGADIVTVQRLLGHSDVKTTRKYLNPDEDLKRKAVNRLSLKG